jgi:transposase InsO family protein
MPWREMSPMETRLAFIREWETELFTMTELAAQYGISRKTGYKWLDRYDAEGASGLLDRSRRPHHSPHATDPELVEVLVAQRQRHPLWGAKKLLAIAARQQPHAAWPCRSTVWTQLKARGLVRSRRRRLPLVAGPRPQAPCAVNEVWTTDFKGQFRTGNGVYCYPLTLRDGFSRFVLRCEALPAPTYDATRRQFERAFAAYGLPQRIRSDNGTPFAGSGLARLSRLNVWWMRLGIVPERIAVGHPEQNGSHEQFHRVLKAATTRPPAASARAQQRRFDTFCAEYNHERPHEALAQQTPAMVYRPSARAWASRLPSVDYAGHWEVRRVYGNGCVWWGDRVLFLSNALIGEDVAFEEVGDGLWTLYFASTALARFDERHRQLHPLTLYTEGRSASFAGSAPDLTEHKRR